MKRTTVGNILWLMYKTLEGVGDIADAYAEMAPHALRKRAFYPDWTRLEKEYKREKKKKNFNQFVSYLKQQGYIVPTEGYSVWEGVKLTQKGREKAMEGMTGEKKKKRRKDCKMILLMYDIPEKEKRSRHIFRRAIQSLDYQLMQKSVWVTEKDVLQETEELIRNLNIENYVNIFIIDEIKIQQ